VVCDKEVRRSLKRLVRALDYDLDQGPPESRASALYMRTLRQRVTGELLRLRRTEFPDMETLTLIPNGSELQTEELSADALRRGVKRLKNYLDEPVFRGANGFFFGGLDGEYRARTGLFGPHFHCTVGGDYKAIIEQHWRGKDAFRALRSGSKPRPISRARPVTM